ncbi:hypothetical protein F7R01_08025 [Pseudomonas argentinensis]|uniref:Uncharacterized protein n=1 Tax=Phytopseudomonas argentinensis TaxID=289370 RepID=A0A1I3JLP3_9GAMM|nr:hypothetical protein [Pseudomonas argentinensis]KAB0551136.1 hypothetical protein F7R01_08025 [Pseudomonas argentinensis]SFI61192.1 hypothetical protein SAMN05216602_1921 [Pseudomonas argentinensis]
MSQSRDHLEMTFRSIQCFADDGRLDAAELGSLLDIAERDGVIDDDEIRVLTRIKPDELDPAMREKLAEIARKIGA